MSKRLWLWLAVVAVVGAGVWKSWTTIRGPELVGTLEERPECGGHGYDTVAVDVAFRRSLNVPEFNDCQRFIVEVDGVRKYQELYAIFVSSVAPSIITELGAPLAAVTSAGASIALGNPPPAGTAFIAPANTKAITIAMVDADGSYSPLGIVPGLNCLYVWYFTAASDTIWTAKMTHADADGSCGQKTVQQLTQLAGKVLEVKREKVKDSVTGKEYERADYPGVARWDWDFERKQQYVSIVCDVAWCQIGEQNFVASPPLPPDGATNQKERRVRLIKGWHDQQYLAKRNPDGTLAPSELIGTIFPEPDLGVWDSPSDFNGWKTVGWIVVDPTTPDAEATLEMYKKKLGFRRSTFTKPLRVQMKNMMVILWLGRVQHRLLGPIWGSKENHVKFRATGTPNFDVPGTARWRWKDVDEGTWTRCTSGCCEMSD